MHDDPTASPLPRASRRGRVWSFALAAAVLASLMAWCIEEASVRFYGEQMTTQSAPAEYRTDLRKSGAYGPNMATMAYKQEFTTRAVATSAGGVGAMCGLAMGFALGIAGGGTARGWLRAVIIGLLGAAAGGGLGWFAAWQLIPLYYKAKDISPGSADVLGTLLLIRGAPRLIAGMVGGLALGIALGGGPRRLVRGAAGGLVGALVGVVLAVVGGEMADLWFANAGEATAPILRSPLRRFASILAVALPTAAFATRCVLDVDALQKPG